MWITYSRRTVIGLPRPQIPTRTQSSEDWSKSMPEIEEALELEERKLRSKEIRVGIVGYGTVGRAAAEILARNAEEIRQRTDGASIRVTRACRKSIRGPEHTPDGIYLVPDWRDVVEAEDVDLVVEALGGVDTSYRAVWAAIERGKPVVTANKALIADHGEELFALAGQKQVPIGIEATVGGGVPIIRAIAEALAADRIQAVYGIVNGTANFILTQMESHGVQLAEALKQAQAAGYAEADPSLDVDGLDARDKISILARLAFNASISPAQI